MANKTVVLGVVQRGGRVMAVTVPNQRKGSLLPDFTKPHRDDERAMFETLLLRAVGS